MSAALIVPIVVAALAAFVALASVVVVPAGQIFVVERLGRYDHTLAAGVHVLVPFVDAVRFKLPLGEQTVAVPNEACRTRDDRQAWIDGAVAVRITDPRLAAYDVADYRAAIAQSSRPVLRHHIAGTDLDRLHGDRSDLCAAIAEALRPTAAAWGLAVLRFDMTDIRRHNKESAA